MSVVIGILDQERIYMGADSLGSNSQFDCIQRKDPKIFKKNGYLIGYVGSYRLGQVLRFHTNFPKKYEHIDPFKHMVTEIAENIRTAFSEYGINELKEDDKEGCFLIGFCSRLFTIFNDYQIGENQYNYSAIGAGEKLALGSLYSSTTLDARARVKLALQASQEFCSAVRKPFKILSIEKK